MGGKPGRMPGGGPPGPIIPGGGGPGGPPIIPSGPIISFGPPIDPGGIPLGLGPMFIIPASILQSGPPGGPEAEDTESC